MKHKLRVLVTGHTGFIGRNMVEWCRNEDWIVEGWEWSSDRDRWPHVQDYDWVIHLGAIADSPVHSADTILAQNFDFSCWLFDQCNKYGTNFQYASSDAVYGQTRNFSEYAECAPLTAYAWSKFMFDRWVFQQTNNIYVQGFRYFDVYGKYMAVRGERANVIHKFREQAQLHKRIDVYENADMHKRDWVWVGDVCKLHIDFIKSVNGSGLWNCGSGLSHSFLDIAEEIAEQEGAEINIVSMPDNMKQVFRTYTCADLTHLKETIGKRKWLNVFEYLEFEKS